MSGSGVEGGASRALVFLNFPAALVALPVLALLSAFLAGPAGKAASLLAAALCCAVFWPGVVSEANLDAQPVNAIAAAGVALALVLTAAAAWRRRLAVARRRPGDAARIVVGIALVLVSIPWIAADLGFFLGGVPVLGRLFQTEHAAHPLPGEPASLPAVHHGHHHGMDGLLLVLAALLLSRAVGAIKTPVLRTAASAYLALLLCYGAANMANDFWGEQVVKRGWTSWRFPDVLHPQATLAWGLVVLAAALLWAFATRWARRARPAPGSP